jgi:hypothetical protein
MLIKKDEITLEEKMKMKSKPFHGNRSGRGEQAEISY